MHQESNPRLTLCLRVVTPTRIVAAQPNLAVTQALLLSNKSYTREETQDETTKTSDPIILHTHRKNYLTHRPPIPLLEHEDYTLLQLFFTCQTNNATFAGIALVIFRCIKKRNNSQNCNRSTFLAGNHTFDVTIQNPRS